VFVLVSLMFSVKLNANLIADLAPYCFLRTSASVCVLLTFCNYKLSSLWSGFHINEEDDLRGLVVNDGEMSKGKKLPSLKHFKTFIDFKPVLGILFNVQRLCFTLSNLKRNHLN